MLFLWLSFLIPFYLSVQISPLQWSIKQWWLSHREHKDNTLLPNGTKNLDLDQVNITSQIENHNLCLLLFGHPVVSASLHCYGLQLARPLCPSPSPGICLSSYPLHRWCHSAISFSDALFSSYPQSFPASRTFKMSQLFSLGDQNTSPSASVLPMNIQGWFPLRLTGLILLLSRGLLGVFSSTTVQSINSLVFCLLYSPSLTQCM